jgi:hypothetical protein
VQIIAPYQDDYMNSTNQHLEPGETVSVLDITTLVDDDIQFHTPDAYRLVIRAKGNQRILDKAQFLRVIKRANDGNYWIINDQSLCP